MIDADAVHPAWGGMPFVHGVTRMDQTDTKPAIFSLRLTFEERTQLEHAAAGLSLGAYIRARVFDPANPPPRHRGKAPVKDHKALANVLAMLGQSRLSSNLNQLAHAANIGLLPVTPETEAALNAACRDIAAIRHLLLVALGLAESGSGAADTSGASKSGMLALKFASASSGETEMPVAGFNLPRGFSAPRSRPRPPSV